MDPASGALAQQSEGLRLTGTVHRSSVHVVRYQTPELRCAGVAWRPDRHCTVTPELLEFIRSCFSSVWSLELLLLLQRDPERGWTSEELVSELRASGFVVDRSLETLVAAGLAVTDGEARASFRPASAHTARLAAEVADLYKRKPDQVRRAILTPESNLQALADAFRLRRDS